MAKCKFCGKPVKSAPVFHAKCLEAKMMEAAQQMCGALDKLEESSE